MKGNKGSSQSIRRGCSGRLGEIVTRYRNFMRRLCEAFNATPYEYVSPGRLFGIPLFHVNLGFDNPGGRMRRACGIISIGNQAAGVLAFGLFTAWGLFAIAPLATGGVALCVFGAGLVTVSVVGIGVVSVSIFAIGYVAVGILSLGVKSVGIVAFGESAVGILAIGREVHAVFHP
ncbi:MAG: hypothetical protein FJZ96_15020 [Chloroflexi bacterium]|nr:hypothetical protein [Chloroflexota bacterium]